MLVLLLCLVHHFHYLHHLQEDLFLVKYNHILHFSVIYTVFETVHI